MKSLGVLQQEIGSWIQHAPEPYCGYYDASVLEDVRDFGLVLQERHQVTTQVAARIGNGEEKVLQAVSELLVLTESLKTWTGNV